MSSPAKKKVTIYVQPGAKSTIILTKHISKHIDNLNKILVINIIQVTEKNVASIKKMGITRTPTLISGKTKCVVLKNIMQALTPPQNAKERYGVDVGSPDELVQKYFDGVINTQDDEGDDDPQISREDEIRRKMSAFQKRRPEMRGLDDKDKYIRGGRKVVTRQAKKAKFDSDTDFRQAAGIDEQEETPHRRYLDDQDGASILEDYYNAEADKMGRKPNKKPIRWGK
jgi:hypothetical protein